MEILSLFKLRIGSRGKKESRGMLWDGSLNTSAPPGCLILKQPRKNIKGWGLGHEEHADHMSVTALSLLRKQSAPDPLGRNWNDKQNNQKTTQHCMDVTSGPSVLHQNSSVVYPIWKARSLLIFKIKVGESQ